MMADKQFIPNNLLPYLSKTGLDANKIWDLYEGDGKNIITCGELLAALKILVNKRLVKKKGSSHSTVLPVYSRTNMPAH